LTVPGNGGSTALNYTSPVLHTVVLTNLAPNTKYFYQVGDGTTFSSTFNFTSLAAPSKLPLVGFSL
jgi:phosphodiesterase/alkaline phosphatase D-like protein